MALILHGTVSDNTAVLDRPSAKPIIVNGNMAIAQRATTVTGSTAGGYNTVDRMLLSIGTLGTWTIAQTASAPDGTGLTNSYRLDCTTADASPAAGDIAIFSTRLEGQDVQLLEKGTSAAKKVTIAFYVKSNKTGTYIMELDDNDNGRNINQAYTISSADTWEKKVLTFDGDTTGAFGNDNGSSLQLLWWLGAGSNFTSGTLATSWASTTNANRAVGQVNLGDNTANDWSITGIQLEVGDFDANSIPPFQHESFGDNLRRCERYYKQFGGNSTHERICLVFMASTTQARGQIPISMRAAPSIESNNLSVEGTAAVTVSSAAVDQPSTKVAAINFTVGTGIAAGQGAQAQAGNNADARLKLSAEL